MEIIPAVITSSQNELVEWVEKAKNFGRLQVDIVDGEFVNNRTIEDLSSLDDIETELNLDVHLMTKEPIHWVEKFVRPEVDRIIGQIEMMSDQMEFVKKCAIHEMKVGLAVDLETDVEKLDEVILPDLDVVLVMSVKAGWAGQEFDERVIEKIKWLKKREVRVCVDGGVQKEHLKMLEGLGVEEVAVGVRRVLEWE